MAGTGMPGTEPDDRGIVLLAADGARMLFAAVVLVLALLALVAVLVLVLMTDGDGTVAVVCLIAGLGGIVTAQTIWRDHPLRGFDGSARTVGVLVTVAALGLLTVLAADAAIHEATSQDTLGTTTQDVVAAFILAAAPAAIACGVIASVRWTFPRTRIVAALAIVGVGVLASTAGALAVTVRGTGCDAFHLERTHWRAALRDTDSGDALTLAHAIVRCHALRGLTERDAWRLLGPSGGAGWQWTVDSSRSWFTITKVTLEVEAHDGRVWDAHVTESRSD